MIDNKSVLLSIKIDFYIIQICKSMMRRIIKVNTIACIAKPNNVGQPSLLAILPTRFDKSELTSLYVNGLNINNTIIVV